ncbi:MAG: ABC transporter substrate-binding protein [Immundisolibacterales bacterium]|nr:ABC transporter substrate-binding protein [Immundisolibacterales bacterium]
MRKHATRRTLAVLGSALALVAGTATAETPGVTDDTIKIALMVPLTGPAGATVGPGMSAGAQAVWKEVNESGGIHGRMIEWVEEDTGCSAEIGIPGVKKAIYDHEVFMLASGGCSNEILSYRDIVIENGVPFSVWGATNDKITQQPNCCIFRTSLRAGYEGVLQADFARSIPNAERFAIIAQHDAWGQAKYDGVMAKLTEYGITPVADEEMTAETADATPQALRISKANPDVIITDLYPKPTTVFLRAAHQYGLTKLPIILHTSINDLVQLEKDVGIPGAVDNAYTVTFTRDPNAPDLEPWKAKLAAIASEIKLTPYSMWGVTGASVVVEALNRAGRDLTRESFIKAMESIEGFESEMIFGPITYSMDDKDGNKTGMFQKLHMGKQMDVGLTFKTVE